MSDQGHDLFRAQERGAQDEEGVLDEAEGDYRKQGGERGQQQEAAKRRRVMAEGRRPSAGTTLCATQRSRYSWFRYMPKDSRDIQ